MERFFACTLLAAAVVLPSLAAPSAADMGGPDAYGYVWVDSRPPSPTVPFSWIDIVPTGTRLSLKDDACTQEVPIGFPFRFYGTIVQDAYICSNGFITFSVPDSFFADKPIPSQDPPNDRVVALAVDLNPAAAGSGGVFFLSRSTTTPRQFIVTWNGVYRTYTVKPQTFQIVLEQNEPTKDGRIFFQYRTLTDVPSAIVGIENATGTSGLAYSRSLQNNLAVGFLPPSDAGLPPDRLVVVANSTAPPTVPQGATDVPMLALDLSTATNWIDVASIRVTLSGFRADFDDVLRAELWLEESGDGVFGPGDRFLAGDAFSGAPPEARLAPSSPLQIAASAPKRVYVTYDVASTAGVDDWIGARLGNASAISVAFPDIVDSAGFPIDTYVANVRTRVEASRDALLLAGSTPLAPATVAQWDTDRPLLSLRLDADRNFVELTGLRVPLGGNVSAGDVWRVKAVLDRDGDGAFSPEVDTVLAVVAPTGSPAEAILPFSLTVVAGSPLTLLLLLDVAPDAAPGRVLNVTLQPSDFRLPGGSVDRVDAANFPASSRESVIVAGVRPSLAVPWTDVPARADGVWRSDEYLLAPTGSASLDRPAGNRIPGVLTTQNDATKLFVAIAATQDLAVDPGDGVSIAFDTDGDGLPTSGGDDVFVANASGGLHLRYDAPSAAWMPHAPCPSGDNATAATCAAATGYTEVGGKVHRLYEFAIPLALLGVGSPIPPGTALRFALTGPPHQGIVDRGNRSTWPLLFAPFPSLGHFGELLLSSGPAPNQPPLLEWSGEPGYEADGLEPESGLAGDEFLWKVRYVDPDNDPPAVATPRLHVLKEGVELPSSPFAVAEEDNLDTNYRDGKAYARYLRLYDCAAYSYFFSARDARGLGTATPVVPGPAVACPNQPPLLFAESVSPFVGVVGTSFLYRIAYQDGEGAAPTSFEVVVLWGGTQVANGTLEGTDWLGATDNYTEGRWFEASVSLVQPGTNYTFRFRASDGNTTVTTAPILGPYVIPPPPDRLLVFGGDLAPLVADGGARLVPFLRLTVYAPEGDVSVTSLRFDRLGSGLVDRVLVYHDADGSFSITPGDVILGTAPGMFTQFVFPLSLTVPSTTFVHLLVAANLTAPGIADSTVGFEVADESYVTVGPGDVISPFAAIRSTRTLVNVAPVATGLTVDGHLPGSRAIERIVSDAPVFAWRFQDANAGDVAAAAFNVSVWSQPPSLLWSRTDAGGATSVAYGGPPLLDGATYVLRVRVYDGRLWSPIAEATFGMNTPPVAPDLLAPANMTTGLDANVSLQWRAVLDGDGDAVAYFWWVSETPTFSTPRAGVTARSNVTISLAPGTEYFWKVGASDGYQFAGNASVWRFTTAVPAVPVRGEIRGRVLNGTSPLAGAVVQLLADGVPVAGALTAADGVFRFRDLDLRLYQVQIGAFGYQTATREAEPTETTSEVDLGDIVLTTVAPPPPPPPNGETGDSGLPGWVLPLIVGLSAATVASLLGLVFVMRRRRGEENEPPER